MKEKIAWKVVTKDRASCSISYGKNKYFRIYTKGEIVTAVPNSLGIFCFRTRQNARDFNHWMNNTRIKTFKILKVKPLSEGMQPELISFFREEESLDQFYLNIRVKASTIPHGTICYQSIQVLD